MVPDVSGGGSSLTAQIAERRPLASEGYSGNIIEHVTLTDGRHLVLKRVSREWDWLSRATGDDGRIVRMWERDVFSRIPPALDHATVAVEGDAAAWSVFMRDVGPSLIPGDRRLDADAVGRVLAAMAEL